MDLPPDVAAAMDQFADGDGKPAVLRFSFRYQPWQEVLQWFADQCDLSLLMETPPPGTFNYTDNRSYSPAEALDLLNSVLLIKGYTLVRRERMLFVVNLEDVVPEELVTWIPVEDLDNRGEFELIGVLFSLDKFEPQEAATEIKDLLGPQGSVKVLPKTRQLRVVETAGRLRMIRDVIQRVEDPQGILSGNLESYEFKHILPDEGLTILRQLLGISGDASANGDDSFRFAMDPVGMRLLFSGSADKIAKAKKILESIDASTGEDDKSAVQESLQLEVYPIAVADPESVLKVMQTLLEGLPGVRLSIDPKTGSLIALARPTDHKTIRTTIDQMQREVRRFEVIPLRRVDPQLAAVSIKKMFGGTATTTATTSTGGRTPATPTISTGPTVEADSLNRQLIVYGTEDEIVQIRSLLGKMGEPEFADGVVPAAGSRIRVLPITGSAADAALENLRQIWPTLSNNPNPIKVVTPSAIIPSLGPRESIPARVPARELEPSPPRRRNLDRSFPLGPQPDRLPPPVGVPQLDRPSSSPAPPAAEPDHDRQTLRRRQSPFLFAAQATETEMPAAAEQSPSDKATAPPAPEAPQPTEEPAPTEPAANPSTTTPEVAPSPAADEQQPAAPKEKPPIVVSLGPNGLMIASDDVEALDEFERLLNTLTGGTDPGRTELNIFYLKHAKATAVAETLTKIIGSGTSTSTTASQDNVLGQLVAGSVGSTLSSLLNLGATTLSPTGMLRITPEPRLNALFIEANTVDMRNIEEVLKKLDMPESPEEVLVNPRARLIPVQNMAADDVAEIVKQIFADKMQSASSRGGGDQQQRPSPADFFAAMRGEGGRSGGQRGGSSGTAAKEEPERMTIGVDAKSNSLILFASQSTYEEVRMLVEELDSIAGVAEEATTEVVKVTGNAETIKSTLMAILGENAVSNSSSSSSGRGSTSSRSGSSRTGTTGPRTGGVSEDFTRRMEMMRSMMGGRGGFGGGGFRGPGGGGFGSSRGGGR